LKEPSIPPKNCGTIEPRGNSMAITLKIFWKIQKLFNFRNVMTRQRISQIPEKKTKNKQTKKTSITEISGKKFSKMWVCFARLSSFPEIPGNSLSLATGKFRKFKPESLVERKALSARSIANTHI